VISLCVPTRERPDRFQTMFQSAVKTAQGPIEVCAFLDANDQSFPRYPVDPRVRYGTGERPYVDGVLCTSELWTSAARLASGDILMLAADDITFETHGWDTAVKAAFADVPDGILLVYADDGTRRKLPVLPFVSRRWVETVGEFTPAGFQGWYSDTWLWEIAAELRRVAFLESVLIRHHQREWQDMTRRAGEAARASEGGLEGIRVRFDNDENRARRAAQAALLRAKMDGPDVLPDTLPRWLKELL